VAFQRIFLQTDVAQCLQPGLQALGHYSTLIQCNNPMLVEGSVDIDSCLQPFYPQDHRWDYALGHRNVIYYVEVHHVSDSEVQSVIDKLRWLHDWQNRQPNSQQLKTNSKVHWVNSSSGGSLSKNSKYFRRLSLVGIAPPSKVLHID
jgi:hypothetical protein